MSERDSTENDAPVSDYMRGWTQGVADTGARLIGAVTAELGPDHPLVERLVQRLGSVVPPAVRTDPTGDPVNHRHHHRHHPDHVVSVVRIRTFRCHCGHQWQEASS